MVTKEEYIINCIETAIFNLSFAAEDMQKLGKDSQKLNNILKQLKELKEEIA